LLKVVLGYLWFFFESTILSCLPVENYEPTAQKGHSQILVLVIGLWKECI